MNRLSTVSLVVLLLGSSASASPFGKPKPVRLVRHENASGFGRDYNYFKLKGPRRAVAEVIGRSAIEATKLHVEFRSRRGLLGRSGTIEFFRDGQTQPITYKLNPEVAKIVEDVNKKSGATP